MASEINQRINFFFKRQKINVDVVAFVQGRISKTKCVFVVFKVTFSNKFISDLTSSLGKLTFMHANIHRKKKQVKIRKNKIVSKDKKKTKNNKDKVI